MDDAALKSRLFYNGIFWNGDLSILSKSSVVSAFGFRDSPSSSFVMLCFILFLFSLLQAPILANFFYKQVILSHRLSFMLIDSYFLVLISLILGKYFFSFTVLFYCYFCFNGHYSMSNSISFSQH